MLNTKLLCKPPPDMAVCRVCTGRGRQLVPFARFDAERTAYRLADAIYTVCGVRVASGDGLPQHCCVRCLRDIETGYKVQQRCRESNAKLLAVYRLKETLAALKGGGLPDSGEARWEDSEHEMPLADAGEIKTETEGDFEELHFKEEIEEARLQDPLEEVFIKQEPTEDVEEVAECHDKEEEPKDDDEEFYEVMEIVESTDSEEDDVAIGPIGGFKCCSCKHSFLSIRELEEHVRIVGNVYSPQEVDRKVQCKVYTASIRTNNGRFVCDICYQNFATRNDLFEHKKQFRKEGKKYPCTECGDGFFTFKSLQMHRKYHRPDVTNCHMCPFVSNCPLKLRSHVQRHCTLNDTFKCLVCAKCFSESSILAKHSATHPIKTKFKCPHCPRMFNYDKCLKRHIERHVQEGSVVEQKVADEEETSE
ncbi:hypothetical protein pipiens_015689 [Culex pipiens pipiens]|uniref:Uncharacterized protein n=1 Tax=Culex pipiens pipiens TaxID=38569 RepID=A0ABD1CR44_CULPP